jgi:hypothetical protein
VELLIDTVHKSFTVGRPFEPKRDDNGIQKLDRQTRLPLFTAQLVAMDERGADTIMVTIAGNPPQLTQGQPVNPVRLIALPWANNGRSGVAFRADEIRTLSAAKSA